ncbi:sensor histidine kinase [Paenibacillus lupini]|uniref:sensor histidine kinase n=1 Tax=Paenibacillus lupini TaxID=1450204 RepID=UPI00142396A4|nr:sensor histidine kinase [Paenibacillus lupini]NIK23603.1 two-component system sensor histidine kinase YesM [Paenibacillus lupini]
MKAKRLFFPMRLKFVVLLCGFITAPFLISGIMTYYQYSKNVEEDSISYTNQIINQVSINVDRYINDVDRLTMAPYYDNAVLDILKKHGTPSTSGSYVSSDQMAKMNLMISSLAVDRSEIQGILLFAYDGTLFSNLQNTVSKSWDAAQNDWMKEAEEADGELIVLPPHTGTYYLDEQRQVVSIVRVIRETFTNKHLGIIKVDLTDQGFAKILAGTSTGSTSLVYLTDRQDRVLYPFSSTSAATELTSSTPDFIKATKRSDYTGIQVTGLVRKNEIKEGARSLAQYTLWITVISILIAYIAAGIASGRMVRPIRELQMKMRRVQRGDFAARAKITTSDEMGQMTEGFNVMVSELERLVKEVYESKIRQRDAELDALQSQINPHFIYNTLEAINSLAMDKHQEEISDIAVNLGKLLRYTVERKERFVYLRDELSFVEAYSQIQGSRLGEQIEVEIHVELGHDYLMVPKLILQPFIENAIEHAMGTDKLTVRLHTKIEDDHLIIFVEDNGMGISPEKMQQVEQHIYATPVEHVDRRGFGEKKKGFALRNVHWRLFLLYGEGCGLFIDKNNREGTVFYLRLPLLYEEEEQV